ncbi:hypothetical protein, partial [Bacteroides pyogenes]|uniref:hypothetical protein n=1 Tax=Bacteroides pyogenes TaxID=310300 RepID=UPI001BA88D01
FLRQSLLFFTCERKPIIIVASLYDHRESDLGSRTPHKTFTAVSDTTDIDNTSISCYKFGKTHTLKTPS